MAVLFGLIFIAAGISFKGADNPKNTTSRELAENSGRNYELLAPVIGSLPSPQRARAVAALRRFVEGRFHEGSLFQSNYGSGQETFGMQSLRAAQAAAFHADAMSPIEKRRFAEEVVKNAKAHPTIDFDVLMPFFIYELLDETQKEQAINSALNTAAFTRIHGQENHNADNLARITIMLERINRLARAGSISARSHDALIQKFLKWLQEGSLSTNHWQLICGTLAALAKDQPMIAREAVAAAMLQFRGGPEVSRYALEIAATPRIISSIAELSKNPADKQVAAQYAALLLNYKISDKSQRRWAEDSVIAAMRRDDLSVAAAAATIQKVPWQDRLEFLLQAIQAGAQLADKDALFSALARLSNEGMSSDETSPRTSP